MTLHVGAYDPAGWAGLVLTDAPGRGFAVRLAVERDGERADGDDLFYLVHEVGPHAPDGSYARVSFDTSLPFGRGDETPIVEKSGRAADLTLEWSRTDEGAVLRAVAGFTGTLELRGYFPWDWAGTWRVDHGALVGASADGEVTLTVTPCATCSPAIDASGEGVARFDVRPGTELAVKLTVSSPARPISPTRRPSPTSISDLLTGRASAYTAARPSVSGVWHGLIESIANSLHWMVLLQPEHHRRYTPAGRRWVFPREGGGRDHWTVFCWDALFNALELAVESPELAAETLDAVLETQYDDGNVPNWRGRFFGTRDRSQPPIGAFTALSIYLRHGDRSVLHRAFARLERWSAWWSAPKAGHLRRDGNGNGLFEWGSDLDLLGMSPAPWERRAAPHQLAAWESGQDDLPNWDEAEWVDERETLDLDAVDLNSYLALDLECLGHIADVMGLTDRAAAFRARYDRLAARMNESLWDDTRGVYVDRRWDGRLSPRVAASNFLPLVAGVPPRDRAERMLETLCDPRRFWGEWIVPTISRD
ncbi:MAG: trehalase family glycosidase, partial [Gemmatimonadales bacterium]